jgi:hypothetical protein
LLYFNQQVLFVMLMYVLECSITILIQIWYEIEMKSYEYVHSA